jgi:ribonuclease inhibitor
MKEIIIDGSTIFTSPDLHEALASALALPAHYGKNLDALYDCLTEIGEDTHLQLHNWHHIEAHLKDYSGKAVYVFHVACQENPHLHVSLEP